MPCILVVDEDPASCKTLRRLLERHDCEVCEAASVSEAVSDYSPDDFDLVIAELRLSGAPGTDLIGKTGGAPILITTGCASLRSAVDSMRLGAADYIAKPYDPDDMMSAVQRALAGSGADMVPAEAEEGFVGSCPQVVKQFDYLDKIAPTDATVLVLGETGTGKELMARGIHQRSARRDKPLIAVNCAAIPETLIESELFGYEKGAFTGALTNRTGLIEAADGGTLFLDEIGELPFEAQARLLRFIQEGEIRRVGSVDSRRVNVRLICATHRNLQQLTEEGRFRHDLYHRINVLRLQLPPLRARGKDILDLAEYILDKRSRQLNKSALRFSPAAIRAITTYAWPGNVRELENAVERAVILADSEEIDIELLGIEPEPDGELQGNGSGAALSGQMNGEDLPENLSLEDYFQRFVLEHQDSMSETELARKLGVSRKCLWERRQRLGIPRKKAPGRSKARKSAASALSATKSG